MQQQLPAPTNRWYLAYNSDMPSGTFLKRGIVPLASHVVRVPNVELIFNVPFLPFCEPTLANLKFTNASEEGERSFQNPSRSSDVIGIVYLLTLEDYRKIVALESRGTLYKEAIVKCYPLSRRLATVLDNRLPSPTGSSSSHSDSMDDIQIIASTLVSPHQHCSIGRPSKRYVDLMKYGANEHRLPPKYCRSLENIPCYEIKGFPHNIGAVLFLSIWLLPLSIPLVLQQLFTYEKINYIYWFFFQTMWKSYGHLFEGTPYARDNNYGTLLSGKSEKELSTLHTPQYEQKKKTACRSLSLPRHDKYYYLQV